MCGIIGYVGKKRALPILLTGLSAMEYRGYDSAGVCVQASGLVRIRAAGKIEKLRERLPPAPLAGTAGIAHTRWATHGVPDEANAHPHMDCHEQVAIVHNGIIENYSELREGLKAKGHTFTSQTDSEVLAHLIESECEEASGLAAIRRALKRVRGTYGIVVIFKDIPQTLFAARMGSPLVIGVGAHEHYVASDPSAILAHTRDVIFLDDGELAAVSSEGVTLAGLDEQPVNKQVERVTWEVETAQKNGNPHFMLKEILEQSAVVENSTRGRIDLIGTRAVLGGLRDVSERLEEIDRIIIIGCGSAYYAGLVGEYLLEELTGIPVEVELGSEFRYRKPIISARTAVLAISQSGETADTLEAVREAKRKHALTLGLVNVVGSTVARETDAGVYNHAGPEIGVASTKAFLSQLSVLALMGVYLGALRGVLPEREAGAVLAALYEIPDQIQMILEGRARISQIVKRHAAMGNCLFLGRKYQAPIAYEGALKLKEVSYVHAEGYSCGEMKHGPIALIDTSFPSVVLCPLDSVFEKTRSNMEEIRARGGKIIAITTDHDAVSSLCEEVIIVPKTLECLQPLLTVIPTQILAYEMAVARGFDPDRPRNLAKSVTVE
ncbi:glutamine--fructose-6-phosphate transaminase (isomerizing) [Candidatus Uhrbacteria bacterium]|nr:glutamine--fructose-6-phosphate transaminase (isomerizing) [Candidatus Uhrbacteria bacterium]